MPFGAGFVVAFVVLPALLGCDVEDDVLVVVLSGFGDTSRRNATYSKANSVHLKPFVISKI
jgi:hypothetical protein